MKTTVYFRSPFGKSALQVARATITPDEKLPAQTQRENIEHDIKVLEDALGLKFGMKRTNVFMYWTISLFLDAQIFFNADRYERKDHRMTANANKPVDMKDL